MTYLLAFDLRSSLSVFHSTSLHTRDFKTCDAAASRRLSVNIFSLVYLPLLGALFAPPRVASHAAAPHTHIIKSLTSVRPERDTLPNEKKIIYVFLLYCSPLHIFLLRSNSPSIEASPTLRPHPLVTWEELPCFEGLYCLRLHAVRSLLRRPPSPPCRPREMMVIFL